MSTTTTMMGGVLDRADHSHSVTIGRSINKSRSKGQGTTLLQTGAPARAGPPKNRSKNSGETIMITREEMAALLLTQDGVKTLRATLQTLETQIEGKTLHNKSLTKDFQAQSDEIKALQEQKEKLEARIQRRDDSIKAKDDSIKAKDGKIENLETTNADLAKQLQAITEELNRLRNKKGDLPPPNEDVKKEMDKYIKQVIFREVKFARGNLLQEAMSQIYEGVKGKLWPNDNDTDPGYLDVNAFTLVYSPFFSSVMSYCRQYKQTQLFKAVQEWCDVHKKMPTLDEMKRVWKFKPAKANSVVEETDEYKREYALFEWYNDVWLGHAGGHDDFGPSTRYYKMSIDQIQLKDYEKERFFTAVTVASEAFALLIYENCQKKWAAVLIYLKNNKKKKTAPKWKKDDKATHVFHTTKWSDSKTGQVKGGGWAPEAYDALNDYIKKMAKYRNKDGKNQWQLHKSALSIVRAKHKITEEEQSKKRKGQTKTSSVAKPKYTAQLIWTEDMEHSDDSDDE